MALYHARPACGTQCQPQDEVHSGWCSPQSWAPGFPGCPPAGRPRASYTPLWALLVPVPGRQWTSRGQGWQKLLLGTPQNLTLGGATCRDLSVTASSRPLSSTQPQLLCGGWGGTKPFVPGLSPEWGRLLLFLSHARTGPDSWKLWQGCRKGRGGPSALNSLPMEGFWRKTCSLASHVLG